MTPSVTQLLIVLLIVVLLFGAKKIPELAKGLGKGIKTFKNEMDTKESENVQSIEENKEAANKTAESSINETAGESKTSEEKRA